LSQRSDAPFFAMAIVATALPIRLVIALASDMNRSTPRSSVRPAIGTAGNAESVAASVMKPPPVTAAAPFEVSMRSASIPELLSERQVYLTRLCDEQRRHGHVDGRAIQAERVASGAVTTCRDFTLE
jgi:hypothetical protein